MPETPPSSPGPMDTPPSKAEIWGQRLWLIVRVLIFIQLLGMPLTVLPWTPMWEQNSLLAAHPHLKQFMAQGFVRGTFTGLGLVNIWIGVWEAVHYRE